MEFVETPSLYWYAIYVRSRHEFKVLDRLSRAGIEVFLPTVERLSRWKDRRKIVTFPLFPGYLFVHINRSHQDMLAVLKTDGVVRFLSSRRGEPEPVPTEQIMSLKRLVESKETINPYPFLKEGERVRIIRGPLTGAIGILVRRYDQHIFVVSIDILGRSVSVKIDATDVEPY
jgi:transcription antitermination factor NusG